VQNRANLASKRRYFHQLLMIMVVNIISISWVLYMICYRAWSTSAECIAEGDIWGKLSQNFSPVILLMIEGGSCKCGVLVKVVSLATRAIMVDS